MSTRHRRKPYMPNDDLGKKMWMEQFLAQLQRDPKRYGFDDPSMFEYVQRTIRNFIEAVQKVKMKAMRSPDAVLRKNEAREAAVRLCRDIAMRLKFDPNMTLEDLSALGIRATVATPEDAKLPGGRMAGTTGFPTLRVEGSSHGAHVIRYGDSTSPSKAKPKGVSHLLLYGAIGEKPFMRQTHARLLGAVTKQRHEVPWPTGCGIEGLYVTYYGRWLTTRGEISPWSQGVPKMIGDTMVNLRDSPFNHLFGERGFIDALPEGVEPALTTEHRPLLEGARAEETLFAALEAKMDAKMLPWHAFALLETEMAARVEDTA